MNNKLHIVKIGGQVLDDPVQTRAFLTGFCKINGLKILVHGGGKTAGQYLQKMGIEPKMKNGRRVTDLPTLDVVTMVYAGLTNKKLVSALQGLGLNAIGLSGADMNCIVAHKREVREVDYGYAGDIDHIDSDRISDLLNSGISPVFCSITHDGKGQLLNTNADTIASMIARSLSGQYETALTFCFEQKGIMTDLEGGELIPTLTRHQFESGVKDGKFSGGILPKLTYAFEAIEQGVSKVVVCHHSQAQNIGKTEFSGTILTS